jgi:hypothetical protein
LVKCKDPSKDKLGDPRDLHNNLLDSALHFSPSWTTGTLTTSNLDRAFTATSPITYEMQDVQYHAVPAAHNKDIPEQTKRIPLGLIHTRLRHRHCCSLLAAYEYRLWKVTMIRMSLENGYLSCGIATAHSAAWNKQHHNKANRPGKYIFIDIYNILGLTPSSSYTFYLIIIDAYSRNVQFYRLPDKSTEAVVQAIKQYQANNIVVDAYR